MQLSEVLLLENVELQSVCGRGGMAEVWLGHHDGTGRPVAVKFLKGTRAVDKRFFQQFRAEVRAAAGLNHPRIVQILDYGAVTERLSNQSDGRWFSGQPYMMMEWAEGGSLEDWEQQWSWPEVRHVLFDILDALAHAHARSVVHRDLKPANVLGFESDESTRSVHWKISDFGVAHAVRPPDPAQSDAEEKLATVAGTPAYMAPEQFHGDWRVLGPWSDLYALGALAFRLVTGAPPFQSENPVELAAFHEESPIPRLQARFPVPEDLEGWILRCMAKSPADRFSRAADAARALAMLPERPPAAQQAERGSDADRGWDDDATTRLRHTVEGGATLPESFLLTERADDGDTEDVRESTPLSRVSFAEKFDAATAAGETDREPLPLPPPPKIPSEWSTGSYTGRPQHPVGLRLFELREVPFVNRARECDSVWSALEAVVEHRQPRAIVLRGDSGTGKSRLVERVAQRAEELGVATALEAPCDRHAPAGTCFAELIERWLRGWGLDRRELSRLLDWRLSWLERSDTDKGSTLQQNLGQILLDLVRPRKRSPDASGRADFNSKHERFAALTQLLEMIGKRRPPIVWFDDVQWSREALQFIEFVLDRDDSVPILFLATEADDLPPDQVSACSGDLSEEFDAADVLQIDTLSAKDQRELVDRLLPLASDLARRVAERTEGRPLFAVQLIADWIDQQALELGPEGYVFGGEATLEVPDDIFQLWQQRIEWSLDEADAEDRSECVKALELAAVLGERVERREWDLACQKLGTTIPEKFVRELADNGLIEETPVGWSFAHGMLVESLHRSARETDRWEAYHLACAEAVRELYPNHRGRTARRRARYRFQAGQNADAANALLTAARHAFSAGRPDEARDLLDRRDEILDSAGTLDVDRERARNEQLWIDILLSEGRPEEAAERIEALRSKAHASGWPELHGAALNAKAARIGGHGDIDRMQRFAAHAVDLHESVDNRIGVARSIELLGIASLYAGQPAAARTEFDRAIGLYEDLGARADALRCRVKSGLTYIVIGNFEEAESHVRAVRNYADTVGHSSVQAQCNQQLAKIACFREEFDEARRLFDRATDYWESLGSRRVLVGRTGRAITEIGAGNYADALGQLQDLAPALADAGMPFELKTTYLATCAAAAGCREWNVWDGAEEKLRQQVLDSTTVRREEAWLAEMAGELADRHGHHDRASSIYSLAGDLWRRIGEDEAVRRTEEKTMEADR